MSASLKTVNNACVRYFSKFLTYWHKLALMVQQDKGILAVKFYFNVLLVWYFLKESYYILRNKSEVRLPIEFYTSAETDKWKNISNVRPHDWDLNCRDALMNIFRSFNVIIHYSNKGNPISMEINPYKRGNNLFCRNLDMTENLWSMVLLYFITGLQRVEPGNSVWQKPSYERNISCNFHSK